MNKDYLEIENQLLLYKSKAQIMQMYIELLKRIDKAIEYIDNNMYERYCYVGSEDKLKEILRGKDEN